ncbi:MAG: class I SAM-dependent methyltransferase [Nostoc sp.]|uniref:class I SAM-dependent methyltransferase n=1 Tax=Nostoc sp. TaxID=1180 RepID=UPI002FFA5410
MTVHNFQEEISLIKQHYSNLFQQHGDTPHAVQWADRKTQERRMEILVQSGDLSSMKILDFGCGTGHLLTFLQKELEFTGEYIGYDLSEEMIKFAQNKFHKYKFEQRDVLSEGIPEDFDYILINGVFNNRLNDNWGIMTALLKTLFSHTRCVLAFNALSSYVDYFNDGLFYVNPDQVFRFCKEELSPCVTLRHDYLIKPETVPFEFTVYVYNVKIKPRKILES